MTRKRKILVFISVLLLVTVIIFFWIFGRTKTMSAEVTSSNGAHYSMQLPSDLIPAHINDSDASISLQYENVKRDLHVMVIDESKAKIISFGLDYDLDTYMKIATRAIDNDGVYPNKTFELNGNKAIQTDIKAETKGKKMVYKLTCVETQKFFYQILEWTNENALEQNKSDMNLMADSFKEVDK